ncbi:MAG: OmpA family protein [Myxococcota bacterium]
MRQSFGAASAAVTMVATGWLAAACAMPPLAEKAPMNVGPVAIERGEWRTMDNVVIVTDGSGTTYADESFPTGKALSQATASALPEKGARAKSTTYNAGNIGFGGDARVGRALAPFDRAALRAGVDATHVMGRVDGGGGDTPLHAVLGEVGEQLAGKSGPAAVILYTDGDVHCAKQTVDAARALAASRSDAVCIHAVRIGARDGGEQVLRDVVAAGSSCGSYRAAADVASPNALASFVHGVMVGAAPAAPAPRAAGPNACEGMVLEGVEFATNRADLVGRSPAILDAAAQQLAACPDVRLVVEGHTDSQGAAEYNQGLSERRAASVRSFLVGAGVEASRLTSVGVGEERPIATNDTAEGRQRNRRVELRVR